jgi:hypothetical protein
MPEYYEELDKENLNKIADYFEAWELVYYLRDHISTRDIVDSFPDDIEDTLEDLLEFIGAKERK